MFHGRRATFILINIKKKEEKCSLFQAFKKVVDMDYFESQDEDKRGSRTRTD